MDNTRPTRIDDILCEDLGDELLICDTESRVIHILNPTARALWDLCDGRHTLQEMEQAIREAFQVAAEIDVLGDIHQILEDLSTKGLLVEEARSMKDAGPGVA